MYDIKEDDTLEGLLECHELAKLHFKELMGDKEFELDFDTLIAFHKAGLIKLSTVHEEDKLIGYYMNLVQKDLLTSRLIAKELAIYIDEAYRGGRLFFKLNTFNTDMLKSKGVVTQYITFVHGHNDKLPLRLGFVPAETTYKKELGE